MNKWFGTGFFSHGVHNLTPGESFTLCGKGAIIVDVREDYLSGFKMFKVNNSILEEYITLTPDNYAKVFCKVAKQKGVIVEDCQKVDKYTKK